VKAGGTTPAAANRSPAGPPYAPYADSTANDIYNLLFCDDARGFAPKDGQAPAPWQVALTREPANVSELTALADDSAQGGRVRYLAFARLRALGQPVRPKQLLGVIIEMPQDGGLDTLAAYSEGGVRYINQSGKMVFFEAVLALKPHVEQLFAASAVVVERSGPWDQARRSPPGAGSVRLNFLVSDGLYFGEGPLEVMLRDPMAAPVLQAATALLQAALKLQDS
jgi:hypothetical protein